MKSARGPAISRIPQNLIRWPAAWLTGHEANAAGRLGLFRIVYCVFYLFLLIEYHAPLLYDFPRFLQRRSVFAGRWLVDPPWIFYELIVPCLVASLVLLLLGLWTRVMTAVVLVLGGLLEAHLSGVDMERATAFVMAYIPLFMLIGGDWSATYSLDARRRRGSQLGVGPADSGPRFVLPIRAVMVMLIFGFFTAALYKALPSAPWFTQDNLFGHLTLQRRVRNALDGNPIMPMPWLFMEYPWLEAGMRWFVVIFEAAFLLLLVGGRIRALILSTALIFHAINGIWLGVSFTPILIVYFLFIDLESWRARAAPVFAPLARPVRTAFGSTNHTVLVVTGLLLACATGLLWEYTRLPQSVLSLGGLVNMVTIWYPVLPIASLWFAFVVIELLRSLIGLNRRAGKPDETATA
ncbi:MAG: hypothetical protein AAGI37_01045 [Planctomycetota bacterium]